MKHKEERTTDAERNGRSQERVERQAAEWINSERGRHKRILQTSGQGMGKQARECRRPWGCYMVSQSPFIYLLDYFSGLFLLISSNFSLCLIFYNKFIEIQFTCHKVHLSKVSNSVIFSILTEFCTDHHYLIPEDFYHP